MGTWFPAKRAGKCSHCNLPIEAGQDIFAKSAGVYLCSGCGLLAENTEEALGSMEAGVMEDLSAFPPEAVKGTIAQSMLYLARQLDMGDVSPREVGNYTKELRLSLLQLKDLYPVADGEDETDKARGKRERRARESGGY